MIIMTGSFNKERKMDKGGRTYEASYDLHLYRFRVNAPSKEHMCKSVIIENTRCTHQDISGKMIEK